MEMKKEITEQKKIKNTLFIQIKEIIDSARNRVSLEVNSIMTYTYWLIGKTINNDILNNQRAEYNKKTVSKLADDLKKEYGKTSFSEKNLRRMMQFAKCFTDENFVVSLIRQLSWTHIIQLLPLENSLEKEFYIEMCRLEHWSVRTLRAKINSMLYERTAISKKPEETIKKELEKLHKNKKITPDFVFKDPYLLDFLDLHDSYSEKDLEDSILNEIQKFIQELGTDFAFLDRQKRITIDNEDYYIDLLFYHRRLHCLVAIDLKLGHFEASFKGQMELYLNYLEKYETVEGEEKPIGLILCTGKNEEHIELMHLNESNIRVAEYMTKLPDSKLLEQKLIKAVETAKKRLENNEQ